MIHEDFFPHYDQVAIKLPGVRGDRGWILAVLENSIVIRLGMEIFDFDNSKPIKGPFRDVSVPGSDE